MKDYSSYIRNKSVIFVGACPCLIGRSMGEFIDSFDVIVRSGHAWTFSSDEYKKDYGTKCHVLYANRQYYKEMKPLPVDSMMKRGIDWMCLKTCTESDIQEYSKLVYTRTISSIIQEVNRLVTGASMGSYILYDLLLCAPSKLHVTGIDFFASKKPVFEHDNYKEYLEGYLPDKIRQVGNRINIGKIQDGHNFYGNAKFFNVLLDRFPNLQTDIFIKVLLKDILVGKVKQGDIIWNQE